MSLFLMVLSIFLICASSIALSWNHNSTWLWVRTSFSSSLTDTNFIRTSAIKKHWLFISFSNESTSYLHYIFVPFVLASSNNVNVASKYKRQQWKRVNTSNQPMPVIVIASPMLALRRLISQWLPSVDDLQSADDRNMDVKIWPEIGQENILKTKNLHVYVGRRLQQLLASPVLIQRRQVFHRLYPNVFGTVSIRSIGLRRKLCMEYIHWFALATNGVRRKMHRSTEHSSIRSVNK